MTEHQKLMAQLGAACGCIERCLAIIKQPYITGGKPLSPPDERELLTKLKKALDAVLETAVAIEREKPLLTENELAEIRKHHNGEFDHDWNE